MIIWLLLVLPLTGGEGQGAIGDTMIEKIISGGQTGVDRASLDAALEAGIEIGGWCPAGRDAEDGPIAEKYPLQTTDHLDHTVRTENNVRDSDGTLAIYRQHLQGGTAYAVEMARHLGRPVLAIDIDSPPPISTVVDWVNEHQLRVIHIGGERESTSPGIYTQAKSFVADFLSACRQDLDG